MNEEEKKAFTEMQSLIADQKKQLDEFLSAKKADEAQKALDAKAAEDEKARLEKEEADKKKTPAEIKIDIDKEEIYKKAAKEAVKIANSQIERDTLLKEVASNDYLKTVLIAAEGEEYEKLDTLDIEKAVRIAKEASKSFKPQQNGSAKKMTMDEAMEEWDRQEQEAQKGGW